MHDEFIGALPEHQPRAVGAGAPPLTGIRVLDFTHFIAGPFATMMLADYGADVVKIESPGKGDDFRYYPPADPRMPKEGGAYLWTNRNKRSITLDMKSPQALEIARELVAKSDVLMENFSTGVMDRFGLDYQSCKAINPRLIYVSVSAYGRTGAFKDRGGFDPIVQAESGFMSMNGYPDRDGVRAAPAVMDISAAMMTANAVLLAIIGREKTGLGQYVETVLFDTALTMTGFAAMQYLFGGMEPRRTANTAPDTCPSGLFHCKDKAFLLNSGNSRIFERLLRDVLERPDLADDPDLLDRNTRLKRRDWINSFLDETFRQQPWSYWKPRMRAASVPHGEVRTLAEALMSPEASERQVVSRIPHPAVGWIPNISPPSRLSGTPAVHPKAAPMLGADTADVMKDVLGYDDERVSKLESMGAFGAVAAAKMPA
ncbi:CoA transferase [soil metagenome]